MGLRIHQLGSLAGSDKYVALAIDYERLFVIVYFHRNLKKISAKAFRIQRELS